MALELSFECALCKMVEELAVEDQLLESVSRHDLFPVIEKIIFVKLLMIWFL